MLKYILIIIWVFAFILSCSDPNQTDGACGNGSFLEDITKYIKQSNEYNFDIEYPYDQKYIYYKLENGNAMFFIAKTKLNICTKKHAGVLFQISLDTVPQLLPLKVKGYISWSLYGDDATLLDGKAIPGQIITTKTYDIGLKQAFQDKEGDFDVLLSIEFQDLGDTDKNLDYFKQHVISFSFVLSGDNHFPI